MLAEARAMAEALGAKADEPTARLPIEFGDTVIGESSATESASGATTT